jgi:hypothetical protein
MNRMSKHLFLVLGMVGTIVAIQVFSIASAVEPSSKILLITFPCLVVRVTIHSSSGSIICLICSRWQHASSVFGSRSRTIRSHPILRPNLNVDSSRNSRTTPWHHAARTGAGRCRSSNQIGCRCFRIYPFCILDGLRQKKHQYKVRIADLDKHGQWL